MDVLQKSGILYILEIFIAFSILNFNFFLAKIQDCPRKLVANDSPTKSVKSNENILKIT